MTGFLTALVFGAGLSLLAAGLAWLAGLTLQARARQSSPALWRCARLVAIMPLLLAPALYALPQVRPALPAMEFLNEPVGDLPPPSPVQDALLAGPSMLSLPSLELLLAAIYALGLAAALCLALWRHDHRRRLLNRSRIAERGERSLLEREAGKLGLRAPELRLSSHAATPFLTGWRGVIVAPESLLLRPALARHALVHELCHLRRGDERDRLLGSALCIGLWFNWPLRQIERELDAAREIACDREAIEVLGHAQRKAYAATLIETMRSSAQPVSAFGPHSRRQREMRIKAILSGGQTVRNSLFTAGAVLLLAIPVACAQATVTPRRVVSEPVEQIEPETETRQLSQAFGDEFMAVMDLQGEEDWNSVIQTLDPIIADAAGSAYDRAIALQLRGRAYYELDRYDDAIADWRAAIATGGMEPGEIQNYRVNIYQLRIVQGRYDEAVALAEQAYAGQEVTDPHQLKNLAQAYAQAGRFEDGLGYARAAYAATPDDHSSQRLMLYYLQNLGMDAEAAAFESALPAEAPAPPASARTPSPAPAATPQPVAAPELTHAILSGRVSSRFGPRPAQPAGAPAFHGGVDVAAPSGTIIVAPGSGTVVQAAMGYDGSDAWGKTVVLDHGNGWQTLYSHLDAFEVEPGDQVAAGQKIGRVGTTGNSTGPHVHVELHHNGERVDPAGVIPGLR
jgi:murein DD-endopeptidase MepM/ murein hydrolase activator NlpD/beta-lactamase regulating signal transducer with metallopeptidase domain